MQDIIESYGKKFNSNNPYVVAKNFNIIVVVENLGVVDSYYNKMENQKFIHINHKISSWGKKFALAYQLYFALKDIEYVFVNIDNQNKNNEAIKFAFSLLYYENLKQYINLPQNKIKLKMS